MRESVLNQFNQQPAEESADVKLLKRENELEERKKEIEKAIRGTDDLYKRAIFEIDLKDVMDQIERCSVSIKLYNRKRKISRIEKIAGEENVAEVFDFKKEKRIKNEHQAVKTEPKTEIPKDIKGSAGPGFLAGLKEFKESRGNEPRPRA